MVEGAQPLGCWKRHAIHSIPIAKADCLQLQRLCAVAQVSPEVPAVKVGLPVDFFEKIRKETLGGRTLPTWRGELYFELHRGVSEY